MKNNRITINNHFNHPPDRDQEEEEQETANVLQETGKPYPERHGIVYTLQSCM